MNTNETMEERLRKEDFAFALAEHSDYEELMGRLESFIRSELALREQEIVEEIEKLMPTRETKVVIETGCKDPHDTTPESLVAMGYATALKKVLATITKKD